MSEAIRGIIGFTPCSFQQALHHHRDTFLPKVTRQPEPRRAYFVHQRTLKCEQRSIAMKKFLIAAPLALVAGALLTTPASAANWHDARQIRIELNQLDRQIDRARGLSRSEENRLQNQVNQLQKLYGRYARNGFSRGEISVLNTRIDMVRNQLFRQSNDYNGRNGHGGWHNHR
jgi:hypothetical protein